MSTPCLHGRGAPRLGQDARYLFGEALPVFLDLVGPAARVVHELERLLHRAPCAEALQPVYITWLLISFPINSAVVFARFWSHLPVPWAHSAELRYLLNEEMRNAFHWDVGCRQPSENTKQSSQSL